MGAGHVVGTAAGAKQTPATRLFEGKEALLADKIGAEIEEALGLVLEQVRPCFACFVSTGGN